MDSIEHILIAFQEFVESPSEKTYAETFRVVTGRPEFSPYAMYLERLEALVEKGEFRAAHRFFRNSLATLILSPRAHLMASVAAEKLRRSNMAEAERHLAHVCLNGILSSGDGTRDRPYLVTLVLDEYVVLQRQGKEFGSQALVSEDDRHLDRIVTTDGTDIWFDITASYKTLQTLFAKVGKRIP